MMPFIGTMICMQAAQAIEEEKSFRNLLKSMPELEANKMRADRTAKRKEEEAHAKKIEIAEAGRARNFWGN